MINPKLFICADNILRDSQTNTMTIISVIEEIHPDIYPVLIPRLAILLILERDPEDANNPDVRLLITQGDKEIFNDSMNVDFQGKPRTRSIVMIGGMALPQPGDLRLQAIYEDRILGNYVIEIPVPKRLQVQNQQA